MRGAEVRNLQIKRIDLNTAEIHLQKSKTKGGIRTMPLTPDALQSVEELLARALKLGAVQPDHYLIPALVMVALDGIWQRCYDPTKPTQGWRTAWRKLTREAGLKGLRGHDLRHNWLPLTPKSIRLNPF
jgi:integrase